MEASGEMKELLHLPIKPAFVFETSSEFYDPVVKFVYQFCHSVFEWDPLTDILMLIKSLCFQ